MWNYVVASISSVMKHDPYAGYFSHKKSVLLNLQICMIYFIRKQEITFLMAGWIQKEKCRFGYRCNF